MPYTVRPGLSVRKIDDEIYILNRETSEIHALNPTAAFLWEKVRDNAPPADLPRLLSEEFDVTAEAACSDVDMFLAELAKLGLVEEKQ